MKKILAFLTLVLMSLSGCNDGRNSCVLACVPRGGINPLPMEMSSSDGQKLDSQYYIILENKPGTGDGLIIVKVGHNSYKAYDRNPPHLCPGKDTKLEIGGGIITSPTDKAQWNLSTGASLSGVCPLIEYRADYLEGKLYISDW